jgi:hypothetical protein
MKEVQVRCWKIKCFNKKDRIWEDHVITYPDGFGGYKLIICLKCGKIYAVDIDNERYVGPDINTKLNLIKCLGCEANLGKYFAEYPETFIGTSGSIEHFKRDLEIPDDKDSIILHFPEIYSE